MKISLERFEELVSLYIDDEADEGELRLLAICVRENAQMRRIFVRACRIHAATCKLYGKTPKLRRLQGVEEPLYAVRAASRAKVAAEWAGVGALMLLSVGLFSLAVSPQKGEIIENTEATAANIPESRFETRISADYAQSDADFSIVEFGPKFRIFELK